MKKPILRSVVAIVGVALVGAGGAWFWASGKVISQTEAVIAKLNAEALPENGTAKLTYDSITRSSFPSVGVRLVNPVMTAVIPADAQGRPAIDAVWKREGTIDIITDYIANEYRVKSNGAGTLQLKSGTESVNLATDASHFDITLAAKNREAFMRWQSLNMDDKAAMDQAVKDIGGFKISLSPLTMKDADNNNIIYTHDASHIRVANRGTEDTINFDLDLALNGMNVPKEYEDVAVRLVRVMQLPESMWGTDTPFSSTRAGKQDVVIAMNVDIPKIKGPIASGSIHIPTLHITNKFYHFAMPMDVVIKEENSQRSAAIRMNAKLEVQSAAAEETKLALDIITQKEGMGGLFIQSMGATNTALDPELLKQKMMAALPTLSTLGPITLDIDIDASTPMPTGAEAITKPVAGATSADNFTIRSLRFDHTRWGLDAKGMAARTAGAAPTVDVTLVCKRCEAMTQDIYDIAAAAQEVMSLMNPERPHWLAGKEILPKINAALADIGKKDAATGDVTFGISSVTAGQFRINDKPMEEVMMKLMAIFEQLQTEQQGVPPATIPPVPSTEQ